MSGISPEGRADGSADDASLLVVPTGPEGGNMIHFGYVKKNYQWSVIEAFIRCAREPEAAAP